MALCAAVVLLLVACGGKGNRQNNKNVSQSDTPSSVSDSDYEKYWKDYVDTNAMSFEEIGKVLNAFDIAVDDEVLQKAEKAWNQLDPDEMDFSNKVGFVISYVGTGSYDSGKKTFVPSSDKVFCFDLENGVADQSLKTFFDGVNSISGGEFQTTDVKLQSVSKKDKESGVYNRNVKFKLNGKDCSYDTMIYYDWFDTGLIAYINGRIAKGQISDCRLYFMVENHTCEVFCCSKEWAEEFTAKTGCELRTEDV